MATKIVAILLGLTLVLVLACGSAPAAPDPTATSGADTTQAPVVSETSQPTPTPQVAAVPPKIEVYPGKVTWMFPGWHNERFSANYGGGGGNNYARVLHGFLIDTNEHSEMVPGIATDWEISSDGYTWTMTIRDGGKFHDGSDISAEDVWWSWMHYWGEDESGSALERITSSSGQSVARMVDRIEQVEPNQVSITTTLVDASFPFYISAGGPNWWTVLPSRPKVHDDSQEAAYEKNPIAAGPMRLVEYVPASVMRFERFDDFYYQPKNGLPEDRRVNFQLLDMFLVPEEATRVAALRAGEADIAPVSLATRKQVEEGGGRVVFGREAGYIYAGLIGCYEPQFPCHDKRVRQALAYAFDKEMIRDRLFGGPEAFGVEGWAYVTPSSIGYTPDLDSLPFDPEKARQLLAEAGYKTPTSPNGKDFGKLIVNTWPSAVTPFLPESAQLAADYWRRELGIDSEVRVGDEVSMKRSEDALELQGQILWRDDEAVADGGKKVRDLAQIDKPSPEHKDPEIHKMAAEAGAVLEPTQREAALNQMYRRYRDESYRLGVGYYNVPWGVGPRVVEWQPWPFSFYPSNLHGIVLK